MGERSTRSLGPFAKTCTQEGTTALLTSTKESASFDSDGSATKGSSLPAGTSAETGTCDGEGSTRGNVQTTGP